MRLTTIRLLLPAFLCILLCISSTSTLFAAPLAEEHTVLYYLVELQRQKGTDCQQKQGTELPHIIPSENLRNLALDISQSTKPYQELLKERNLAGVPVFYTNIGAKTPQETVKKLVENQCASLMSAQYSYIGAAPAKGGWIVIMAGKDAGVGPAMQGYAPPAPVATPDVLTDSRSGVTPIYEDLTTSQAQPVADGSSINLTAQSQGTYTPYNQDQSSSPQFTPGDSDPAAPAPAQPLGYMTYTTNGKGAELAVSLPEQPQVETSNSPRRKTTATASTTLQTPTGSLPKEAVEMTYLVNRTRQNGINCGNQPYRAPALIVNPTLMQVAQKHAEDMAARGYFSSTTPEGIRAGARLKEAGYTWQVVAENLATAKPPADKVLTSWLYNDAQCKNIMNTGFQEMGVGYSPYGDIWVLTLATPMAPGSDGLIIE